MATQKLQVGRALAVIPSDYANIPFPAVTISSIVTEKDGFTFTDSTADFIALGVKAGDIVYDITNQTAATVESIQSSVTLVLNVADYIQVDDSYVLYNGQNNNGCVLYIGGAGDIAVTTIGGDEVIFMGVLSGQFIPVQTLKLSASGTSATDILALW
tara:strand:- start:11475 stop:11945 length:471 start_codon:yes stop_codon:yes gene_type:complete